jgi:cytochrome c556
MTGNNQILRVLYCHLVAPKAKRLKRGTAKEVLQMERIVLAVAVAAFGITAAVAQSDPIAARKALMKGNNDNAVVLTKIASGEEPFDAAKVNAAFAQWAETAQKLPNLFPDSSKTGGRTRAAPKVWETRSDFESKVAQFAKVVADNRDRANNVDELKVALGAVGNTCDGCHEHYRLSSRR